MFFEIGILVGYIALLLWLSAKGRGHDVTSSGRLGFTVQALAYVATYVSAVALVGFGGFAYAYGLQMLLVAAGNVWFGTWAVYRFLAWPTREWQVRLKARTPAQLVGLGHKSPMLTRALALLFAIFLGVYASAVIKGAALLLVNIIPVPVEALIWGVSIFVGLTVTIGGLRGVMFTEALQGTIMLLGIVMLFVAVMEAVGGPVQGVIDLAALAPTAKANQGFVGLSSGEAGLFVISLVCVTSFAVWAQPQMIQRHFSLESKAYMRRAMPIAMLVVTIVLGGAYFLAALSRLILPEVQNLDSVMPLLVETLLPRWGMMLFVLAIVSASVSTATALFHIAASALAKDLPARASHSRITWALAIAVCVIVAGVCGQLKGQLIAILCTTSWSIVGGTVLVAYVALVRFNIRNPFAAWTSVLAGFIGTMGWYLLAYNGTSLVTPIFGPNAAGFPPFFVGLILSLGGFVLGLAFSRSRMSQELEEKLEELESFIEKAEPVTVQEVTGR